MNENQFLKIKILHTNWIDFEIFEIPAEKWRRPKRYHLQIPVSHLVNRHKRESKIKFLNQSIRDVKRGFDWEFQTELSDTDLEVMAQRSYEKHLPLIRQMSETKLESEFIRSDEKPIETRSTF